MRNTNTLAEIPINNIVDNLNMRQYYDDESLQELGKSFSEIGQIYPVIVERRKDGRFDLIIGSRRLRSEKMAGKNKIRATILRGVNDSQKIIMALSENMQRENLTPFEEARAILKLVKDFEMKIEDIAQKIGRKDGFIRNRLKLLSLPQEIQELVVDKKLNIAQVNFLARISKPEEQKRVAESIMENNLSSNDLATLVRLEKEKSFAASDNHKPRVKSTTAQSAQGILLRIIDFTRWLETLPDKIKNISEKNKTDIVDNLKKLKHELEKVLNSI